MSDKYTWLLVAISSTGEQMKTFASDDISVIQRKRDKWIAQGYDTKLRIQRKAQA